MNIKMKYKIIFLDIDGVLNLIPQGRDKFGPIFHTHFVDNLRFLIEQTNAKIVISSSWRFNTIKTLGFSQDEMIKYYENNTFDIMVDGLEFCQELWKFRNLPGEIIAITPHIDMCKRGLEIQEWLDKNKDSVSNYVILDDDTDMLDSQMMNFVQTSENSDHEDCIDIGYGLTKICANKAIEILNR
jgi:hypothetical protein